MPPVRGRELKLKRNFGGRVQELDAPCAGARIETFEEKYKVNFESRCPLCGGEN